MSDADGADHPPEMKYWRPRPATPPRSRQPAVGDRFRASMLTTAELHYLDQACEIISSVFGVPPYLVGSAGIGGSPDYRDVDIRLILADKVFDTLCASREAWALLCLAIGAYLRDRTGLPVDFQVQRMTEANARFDGPRNPLGTGRTFAGGGDGTPEWP